MPDVKTSQDVSYTAEGEAGKQCKDCLNFKPVDNNCGNCFGHKVSALGSCSYFTAK